MTQSKYSLSAVVLYLMLITFTAANSQELTGPQIIQKVNKTINPQSSWAKSRMTIITSSGKERTFVYESWMKNRGEKNLIRYLEPRRVKGQATLLLNHADDIWMYFPRTQRVRKLATHAKKQKMEGSDFTYEDMGSGDTFIEDYASCRLKDESVDKQDCYCLELTRLPESNLSYSRLIIWVLKVNYLPLRIEYYDDKHTDRLLKTMIQTDIKMIDNIPTAMNIIMMNELDKSQTKMEFIDVKFNLELDDTIFTERGLKK